ncbi:MAG TPA: lysophospholipid acyltransferase family protein [Beijerinckiaceae bacterium]|nr:lysophospholipid acyltransferase family protein [Beijerinckiaceae bacterium]
MLLLRNSLFAVAFYANCAFWFLFACFGYVIPARHFGFFCRGWATTSIWLFRTIIGAEIEVRGQHNIPHEAALVAAKHQSSFETIFLLIVLDRPSYIYKRELGYVPLFGWHLLRAGQIPVDRDGGAEAMASLVARSRRALGEGRQIIIFPEGTRRAVDAPPDYKLGVAQLYRTLGVPCVPVALNSGLAWPRRAFMKEPYRVVVEFLEPIPAGVPAKTAFRRLQEDIETASNRLVDEALAAAGQTRAEIQSKSES